jgi:hypothetical protein
MVKEKELDLETQIKITLASLTTLFKKQFRKLIELMGGGNPVSQMLKMLFYGISNELDSKGIVYWREKQYRTILLNTLSNNLKSRIFDKSFLKPLNDMDEEYKKLFANDEDKNLLNRIYIILSIDKNDLWKDDYSKNVKKYVKKSLIELIEHLGLEQNEKVDVSCIEDAWNHFKRIYKGVSNTKAKQLETYINHLFDQNGYCKIELSNLKGLLIELNDLAYSTAWYGRAEAIAILKALENAKLDSLYENKSEEKNSNLLDRLYAFIHIYASYTLAENNNLYLLSANVSEFINYIYDGFNVGVNNQIGSYKDLLVADVGEEIVSKFEELFS